jgi:ADP-ribosylglycohydrolase
MVWGALGSVSPVDTARLAKTFIRFAEPRPDLPHGIHRGTGRHFREAVDALKKGTPPLEAGRASAGNGAAMRIAPVGVYYSGSIERIVNAALHVSLITHHDPRGLEAAAALAALVGALTGSSPPSGPGACLMVAIEGARLAEEMIAAGKPISLPAAARATSGAFRRVLSAMRVRLDEEPSALLAEIGKLAGAEETGRRVRGGTDGFAPASVTSSIVIGLTAPSFREAVETIVNAGEDTDTCGAMTGAIAGARFGAGAIPESWLSSLVAREPLEAVATAMAGGTAHIVDQEPLEEEWTRQEAAEAKRRAEDSWPEEEEDGDDEDAVEDDEDGDEDE